MNQNIHKLVKVATQSSRRIIGLMSGTSFDGLDVALCEFSGSGIDTKIKLLHFRTVEYRAGFKEELKSVFAKELVDLQKVTLLNAHVGTYFAELILNSLQEWGVPASSVDLIASHGQTIFHAPFSKHQIQGYGNATLQIGDGDHIAVKTGILTLSDFRQKHIAAGGEGAPLAVYGDFLVFSNPAENRIMLNIGGIANFTFLPKDRNPDNVFSTDVGPGNTLMDQFIQSHYPGKYYDEQARVASAGKVNTRLLAALLQHPFFNAGVPKTTGPELFNLAYLEDALASSDQQGISVEDVMATLNGFSAHGIALALKQFVPDLESCSIYVSGGGMHNPLLMANLRNLLPGIQFKTTADLEVNPDAKEAVLFALLANEAIAGEGINYGNRPGVPSVAMGKISFPA